MRNTARLSLSLILLLGLTGCPFFVQPPPPYVFLSVTGPDGGEYYGNDALSVCSGETVALRWQLENTTKATLTAIPTNATSPALDGRTVGSSGSLGVQVLSDATLRLSAADSQSEQEVSLISEAVCTGFPLQPLGRFEGELTQTTPEPQVLPRELFLYWNEGLQGDLRSSEGSNIPLNCTIDELADSLRCTYPSESGDSFELNATVTTAGLQGTYGGVLNSATSSSAVEGSFSFQKSP